MFLYLLCVLVAMATLFPQRIEAGEFENAYTFYQKYENDMAFQPGADNTGEIYYATKGKKAVSSGTQYTTIGWKITMKNASGSVFATLYYQLGGSNMITVDTQIVDGYEYTLYKVTLVNMRSRISEEAKKQLQTANCSIIFDACLVLKVNGVVQGGMTDAGPSWGKVYTTYNGIVGAANWSESTRETLKTYYNKSVEDIYYTVTLIKGEGVDAVYGSGKYCFGTWVTVQATVNEKYVFQMWTGDMNAKDSKYTFVISEDVTLTAKAYKRNLTVNFYKSSADKNKAASRTYYNNKNGQTLPDFGWKDIGLHQSGWSLNKGATTPMYKVNNTVTQNWIEAHIPSVDLYAVWEENSYNIIYDSNGGSGAIQPQKAFYSAEIVLAQEEFIREGYCIKGWSSKKDDMEAEYKIGEKILVSELAKKQGLEYTHEGDIVLHAVWDNAPMINVEPIYVSLEDAKKGMITEEWLAQYASASDLEDGEITYGETHKSSFRLVNYATTDFTGFQKDGAVLQTFCATDSSGNVTKKSVMVYIVDSTVYDTKLIFGLPRFISKEYYKNASDEFISPEVGGLMENSIWKKDASYRVILDRLFQ